MSKEYILNTQKTKLKEFQSAYDKFLNSIKNTTTNLSNDELAKIIIVNDTINQITNDIHDLEISILKKKKPYKLNTTLKERINDYDENQRLISNCKPYIFYSKIKHI